MIKRIKRKLLTYIEKIQFAVKAIPANYLYPSHKSFIALDDIYPLPLSAFRVAEFNYYLSSFPDAVVYTTGSTFAFVNESRSLDNVIASHELQNPEYAGRVIKFNPYHNLKADLIYCVFLHNAYNFLPIIERNSTPFVFTLYPGGGFHLHGANSDRMLRTVFKSPLFRKVIVTQNITYNYLIENRFCQPEQVEFVYGVVTPVENLITNQTIRQQMGKTKDTFDICFVASKYMPLGIDKGYDTFIEVAKHLSNRYTNIQFHVVGGFDEADIDVSGMTNIFFYGPQKTAFFADFYQRMDIILAPNVPFKLVDGAFDGFPTGACSEAGLMGVALFCSDVLEQNIYFEHQNDIVLTTNTANNIISYIDYYYHHYDELQQLAQRGRQKIQHIYSSESQMLPRIELLKAVIAAEK